MDDPGRVAGMIVLSVGEVLWDVFSGNEFLGGAPVNVCANLRRAGDEPMLLTAVGNDAGGEAVLEAMHALQLSGAGRSSIVQLSQIG